MRVLVTGAAGGIGGAAVQRFLAAGAEVIAHDLRLPRDPVADGVTFIASDLNTAEGVEEVRDAIGAGALDCVVAAHGIEGSGAIASITPERARRILDLDFLTVVRLYEAVSDQLGRGGGSFIALSSQAGVHGEANNGAYCAAKFGVVGWTRVLAGEQPRTGIRMHAVCPGCTDTGLLRDAIAGFARDEGMTAEAMTARRVSEIPVGRLGKPGDIAALIVHLSRLRGTGPIVAPVTGGEVLA
jgi:NAD(P)-dependent dehydrogenase (short-subunit alcohol dehydrogenase family)